MTSTASLFACTGADVSLDRVRDLVGQGMPESLTLEYKQEFSKNLVTTVAAMANSYGGLILVGVADKNQPDRLVGVSETAVTQIVNACYEQLEPPWQPEIVPLRLSEGGDSFVLVVRVDPARAPRPILVKGAAPIRLHGRNAVADRTRLAQLLTESPRLSRRVGQVLPKPQLPADEHGSPTTDFIIRSGLLLPVDDAAAWRPLAERGIVVLTTALNTAPIHQALLSWCAELGICAINSFRRRGFNRARRARLVWQAVVDDGTVQHPIEVVAEARLPDAYGAPDSVLQFTVDILGRVRTLQAVVARTEMPTWRLSVPRLYTLVEGVLATLTDPVLIGALADLAGIDPVVVPQPPNLDFITGPAVGELLSPYGLTPVEDAGTSHGANLIADPALDLRDTSERQEQVNSWLLQAGLDAGLLGMERLLGEYQASREPS